MINTREWFDTNRITLKKNLIDECYNCGSLENLNIHHIVPLVKGGTNRVTNLAVLCGGCHAKVHGRTATNLRELSIIGQKKAREKGVKFGRQTKTHVIEGDLLKAIQQVERGEITQPKGAEIAECSLATFKRRLKEYRQQNKVT